jgi:tetratricopeptide (TPR) repeat protein/serine phosphatase RsbU (regulator of sigma subunit)
MKNTCQVFFLWILCSVFAFHAAAQRKNADSLQQILSTSKSQFEKNKAHILLSNFFLSSDQAKSKHHAKQAIAIALQNNLEASASGNAWTALGNCYYVQGNYDSAGYAYRQSINYLEQDTAWRMSLGTAYSNIGLISINKARYSEGLSWQFKALVIYDSTGNFQGMLRCYNAIAVVYNELGELTKNTNDFDNALRYLRKCLELSAKTSDSMGISNVMMNMGTTYQRMGNNDSALWYFRESAVRAERQKDIYTYSSALSNIAEEYRRTGNTTEAKKTALQALQLKIQSGDQLGECALRIILAQIYEKTGEKEKQRQELDAAYTLSQKIGATREQSSSARMLARFYATQGNYTAAWPLINDYLFLNDSLNSSQNLLVIQELKARFDDENQKKQIALLTQQNKIAELTTARQRLLLMFSIGGVALLLLLAALIYRSLRQKKRANQSLQQAYGIIEEKNKSITDSIHYASHLQQAILPDPEIISRLFPQSFILYMPKDIVAGDFYWVEAYNDFVFFAAADCTGHGVPGAMVSVVCSKALDTAVHEMKLTEPGKILDAATEIVLQTFARTSAEIYDGMDISLCAWNPKTKTLQWAGANNPLLIITRNQEPQFIAPDKQPVGRTGQRKNFTSHTFILTQPTQLYLYSDGFGDQFGGAKGKKIMQKKLKELLIEYHTLEPSVQHKKLLAFFNQWKGTLEQIDDILVMRIDLQNY